MIDIKKTKSYQYALWCAQEDNNYVGIYIKKQAKAWIDIVNGDDEFAYIDIKAVDKICNILLLLNHPDLNCTMYEGLEEYAWFFIIALFCTKNKEDDRRYYHTGLLEIARKNFKTFISGVIFVIGLLTEPKFSRFFSVAPDLKISKELQIAIKKIIKSSPLINDDKIFKTLRSEIRCLLTDSEYTPLAYSQDRLDSKVANMFLADEAGALDSYPVEAMRSSQITLFNKLGIIISTQYPNDNNVMIDEIDIAKKTLDGLIDNKRYFALLYEPNDEFKTGDKWQTEDLIIYQSNPVAYAHDYIFQAIKDMRTMAILYENKRENYLCKHNNIMYKGLGVEGYVEITKVKECAIVENLDFWKGKRVYIGLDLSQSDDNTSIAMVTYHKEKIYAKVWGFIPTEKIEHKTKKEHVDYKKMITDGVCFDCGDEVIGYDFVEQFIIDLPKKYGAEIMQVGYDKYNAISTVQKLENECLECVMITQHSSVLHVPTKLLREYILQKNFRYDENRLLEINFQNARCSEDTNLNKYVNKKKSAGKVDMVVSLINATYLLNVAEILDNNGNWGVQT